jgi:hypothetical protein
MIRAKEAKIRALSNKWTTRRVFDLLKEVEEVSGYGEMSLEYDDSDDNLTKDDIKFLRSLGYKVEKGEWETWEGSHGREHSSYKKSKISWE